jgi:hypothetical protein
MINKVGEIATREGQKHHGLRVRKGPREGQYLRPLQGGQSQGMFLIRHLH